MATRRLLPLDELFERHYEIEWLDAIPKEYLSRRYDFPPDSGYDGQILRVLSHSGEDFVVSLRGDEGSLQLITWTDPDVFLALPAGWLINAANPRKSAAFSSAFEDSIFNGHSVHYAIGVPGRGLILLGHCCGITCYGPNGFVWRRQDLFCCDDPKIEFHDDEVWITGEKHGPDAGPTLKRVDVFTGTWIDQPKNWPVTEAGALIGSELPPWTRS
jgi:hypothetical protein